MSLSVGIHENVVFDVKAGEVNGAPVLNVVLSQPGAEEDSFDFTSASTEGGASETTQITDWPIKVKGLEDGKLVDDRRPQSIMGDYKDKVAFRTQILNLLGLNSNDIEWDPFAGLEINTDVIKANPTILKDDVVLAQMTKNLNEQTVRYAQQAKEANGEQLLRVALVRRSKKDHNPKLRDRYLSKTPMAESMDVPLAESKVVFTAGEIKAGLDNGKPAPSDGDTSVDETFGKQVADPSGVPAGL